MIQNCLQKDHRDQFLKINTYQQNLLINNQEEEDPNHMNQKDTTKNQQSNKIHTMHKIQSINQDLMNHINNQKLLADMDNQLHKILTITNYCHLKLHILIKEEQLINHKVIKTNKFQKIQFHLERIWLLKEQLNKFLKDQSNQLRVLEKIQNLNRTDLNSQINGMNQNHYSF